MAWQRNEAVLGDLVRMRAETQPDLDVLTFEHLSRDGDTTADEVRTYADLAERGNRIAAGLLARGMARGDRFALMARNHPEFVETMIAASLTGTVVVPIDPRTRGEKLAFLLDNSGCRGIVCSDDVVASVAEARFRTGVEWLLVFESGRGSGASGMVEATAGAELLSAVLDQPVATVDVRLVTSKDPLQIIYTSGTTGDPKGVVFTNERFGLYAMVGFLFGYQSDERPYTGLSLTHGNAQAVTLAPALYMGLRAVFSERFTKSQLWAVCQAYGCTTFSLLGGMATAVYSEPPRSEDADHAVRFVVSAGMPAAIWEPFERRFGVDVLEWYGAVEGGLAVKPIGQGPVGSFGRPISGLDMKVLDEHDEECPPGVLGEICSRPSGTDSAEVEYYEQPEASAAKTHGGWLRSGDIGHTDEAGWFFFDHRKGGGIRHNGDFINPGFVEKVLAEDPQVLDVHVYGVPAASGAPGEKDVVAALVVDLSGFDPQLLFARCRSGLEPNMVPTYLQIVDEIPKTASEKPQERFLLATFRPDASHVYVEVRSGEAGRGSGHA